MKILDAATMAALSGRAGLSARLFLWLVVRDGITGAPVAVGFWTGSEDIQIQIDGEVRLYAGAGEVLGFDDLAASAGVEVRQYRIQLAAIAPNVKDLVAAYDMRFAPAEVHRLLFKPGTSEPIGSPQRLFRGFVNGAEFHDAPPDGVPSADLALVSESRVLTRRLSSRKSDEAQRARGGDRIRRYGNISGVTPVYWGEKRLDVSAPAVAAVAPDSGAFNPDYFGR